MRKLYLTILIACTAIAFAQTTPTPRWIAQEGGTPTPIPTVTIMPTPTFWPTPISANGEYVGGNTVNFYSGNINYHDRNGDLHKNDLEFVNTEYDEYGKKIYNFSKRNNPAKLIDGSTEEFFVIHNDSDWNYEDRNLRFTLDRVRWTGQNQKVDITPDYNIDGVVYSASEIAVQVGDTYSRLFVLRDRGKTNFEITYLIDASDLISGCTQGANGEYEFHTPGGEPRVKIYPPKVADASFSILADAGEFEHSMEYLGDGIYKYIKSGEIISTEAIWVDVNIYSAASDGFVTSEYSPSYNGGAGLSVNTNNILGEARTGRNDYGYQTTRLFLYFDTSALGDNDTVTNCDLYFYSRTSYSGNRLCAQKGTQSDTLSIDDLNSYYGSSYGYANVPSDDNWGWSAIYFNATGKSDINKIGVTKICMREYDHDYLNSAPSLYSWYGTNTDGLYLRDIGSNYPYLSITVATPTPAPPSTWWRQQQAYQVNSWR